MLHLMKSNGYVLLLNILLEKFITATICVSKLILIPFSPFDIKCQKLNAKNLWKYIFRASERVSFLYFSKAALDQGKYF